MKVFGIIKTFGDLASARNFVVNIKAEEVEEIRFAGFYHEKGSLVHILAMERKLVEKLVCENVWVCVTIPAAPHRGIEEHEVCDWVRRCEWRYVWENVPVTFGYFYEEWDLEIVEQHRQEAYGLGEFDILKVVSFYEPEGKYYVCKYHGFAKRIGPNEYHIF